MACEMINGCLFDAIDCQATCDICRTINFGLVLKMVHCIVGCQWVSANIGSSKFRDISCAAIVVHFYVNSCDERRRWIKLLVNLGAATTPATGAG